MVERGLRGGMCQVSHRKAEANNKYMEGLYNESKPSSYINYLDANNLYGLAMCQKLPYKDVRFYPNALTENYIKESADTSTGYILDVENFPDTFRRLPGSQHTALEITTQHDFPTKTHVAQRVKRVHQNVHM